MARGISLSIPLFFLILLEVAPGEAVDLTIHSVPLNHVLLDDFSGGAVSLSQATPELLGRIKDWIPPLSAPRYVEASKANWLDDDDLVLGYVQGSDARAYPIRILNFHEIVNETMAGRPVLISYCPLCRSGLVFDRRVGDQTLTFGNTGGLYESDLLMYDRETDSFWFQVGGEAIVGTLTGSRLTLLPSLLVPWKEWRTLYPHSLVLSQDTGFLRPYGSDPFLDYDRLGTPPGFPIHRTDDRLDPKEKVLGLNLGEMPRAYSLTRLGDGVVMDTLNGHPLVIFSERNGPAGAAFVPNIASRPLTFALEAGAFKDRETGSQWDLAGRAVAGPLLGQQLTPIPARNTYWFAWVAAFPQTTLDRSPMGHLPQ